MLFLHLKSDEYVKKQHKTKKLVEKTPFSLQAESLTHSVRLPYYRFNSSSVFSHLFSTSSGL
ncbi:hypothetical protein [Bacillus tequilensis]|uniref:hypothetical protein n=1 Tax=Bacillus tequilensis TaxID=227866 RepID=UPI002852CD6C|nr:hypothetical protein [Bacillus tequilensis]